MPAAEQSPPAQPLDRSQIPSRGLFVTGTDTDVGKTYVSCLILRALRQAGVSVGAYKPACSGAELTVDAESLPRYWWHDVESLRSALADETRMASSSNGLSANSSIDEQLVDRICPQRFIAAFAPPLAARLEQRRVNDAFLRAGCAAWRGHCDVLVVEGAGGWLVPLSESTTVARLAAEVGYPVLVVARPGLGTINHSVLTVEAIRRQGCEVAGVVMSQSSPARDEAEQEQVRWFAEENAAEIMRWGQVPVLGWVPYAQKQVVRQGSPAVIDWTAIAGPPRGA